MTALYAPVIPERRPKKIPRKCSTCADKRCAARWRAVGWLHCGEWTPETGKHQEGTDDAGAP